MINLERIIDESSGETKEVLLQLVQSLANQSREIQRLQHEISLLKNKIFGTSSEKAKPSDLPVEDAIFNEVEVCAEELEHQESKETSTIKPKKRKSGRKSLPKTLPRVIIEHDVTDKEKICDCCGGDMTCIGHKISEELKYEPAKFTVIENRRKQYTCKPCNQENELSNQSTVIKTAIKPKKIIPKSIATPLLLASILIAKFCDHLPLYRIERIFERESIHLSRQTLSQWVLKVSAACIPLVNVLQDNVLQHDVSFADETTMQVLKEPGRKAKTKSYIWCFVGGPPGRRSIIYQYHKTRSASVVEAFFIDYVGAIHCDGYAGYAKTISAAKVIGINCMAHARRKFVEALPNGKEKGISGHVVRQLRKLYLIEANLKNDKADQATIKAVRNQKSQPILAALKIHLEQKQNVVPPESPIGKAIKYALNRWKYLSNYLKDGRYEIDNNRCERAIKPFVMGRKAWLFANTPLGAHASARIYTLIESAKANRIEPRAYLEHIFKELPNCQSVEDYEALLPWKLSNILPEYIIEHP